MVLFIVSEKYNRNKQVLRSPKLFKRFLNTIFLLAFAGLLVFSAVSILPDIISVSNTVGGKELPIYCVETEKPQISISFDAACAGCSLRKL